VGVAKNSWVETRRPEKAPPERMDSENIDFGATRTPATNRGKAKITEITDGTHAQVKLVTGLLTGHPAADVGSDAFVSFAPRLLWLNDRGTPPHRCRRKGDHTLHAGCR
jgi:hypothetical protein